MAFNSREYNWSDCNIAFEGKLLTKAVAVEYSEKINREYIRGKGNKPQSINDGDYSVEGSVEMHQSEFEALLLLTGNKGIVGLRDLNLTVAFASASDGRISTRSIIGVCITEWKEAYKSGDTHSTVTLPFMALDIKMV